MPHAKPTDAELMTGGPGDGSAAPAHGDPAPDDSQRPEQRTETPAPQQAPETAVVVLGGVEYTVPAALANAFRSERDRLAGQYGSKLQEIRSQYEAALQEAPAEQPEATDAPPQPDPANLDPTSDKYDPHKYHRDSQAYTQYLIDARAADAEARRQEEQAALARASAQQSRWNAALTQFYKDNPELRGYEDVVDAVWRRNFEELAPMQPKEGFAELAKRSKQRLLQITESGKQSRRAPVLETSGATVASRASRREPEVEPNEPVHGGLSAAIRAKNKRFRNPNFGTAA